MYWVTTVKIRHCYSLSYCRWEALFLQKKQPQVSTRPHQSSPIQCKALLCDDCIPGVVDRLFARIGASDNVVKHMSTFHMEMSETAHVISHATPHSLVIIDEIGTKYIANANSKYIDRYTEYIYYIIHGCIDYQLSPHVSLFNRSRYFCYGRPVNSLGSDGTLT